MFILRYLWTFEPYLVFFGLSYLPTRIWTSELSGEKTVFIRVADYSAAQYRDNAIKYNLILHICTLPSRKKCIKRQELMYCNAETT